MNRGSFRGRRALFVAAYLAFAAAACLLVALLPGSLPYRVVKCAPLLLLCAARLRDARGRLAGLVGLGLFASLVGDVVIDSVFVAGLGAFLVGHVFYLAGMGFPARGLNDAWKPALPALVFGGLMWGILVGAGRAPAPLHVPITVYAIVIASMLGRSIGRAFAEPRDLPSRVFFWGATFFVVSDSLIGVNHWVFPVPFGSVWILSTYYVGQLLIFGGSLPPLRTGDKP